MTVEGINTNTTAEDAEAGITGSVPTNSIVPVVPRTGVEPASKVAGPTGPSVAAPGRNVGAVLIYNGSQFSQVQYDKEGNPVPEPAPKKSN